MISRFEHLLHVLRVLPLRGRGGGIEQHRRLVIHLQNRQMHLVPVLDSLEAEERAEIAFVELLAAERVAVFHAVAKHDARLSEDEEVEGVPAAGDRFHEDVDGDDRPRRDGELRHRHLGPQRVVDQVSDDQRYQEVERRGLHDDALAARPRQEKKVGVRGDGTNGDAAEAHVTRSRWPRACRCASRAAARLSGSGRRGCRPSAAARPTPRG